MSLHPVGLASQRTPPWFALYVKSHHEKLVSTALSNKGYVEFLPLYRGRHRHAGRFRDVDLPLFPNYVFCRFDPQKRLPILVTPGVFQIVGSSQGPEPVSDSEMEAVERIVGSGLPVQPWPFLQTGDRVNVVEGPLQGAQGIVEAASGECRLIVSITLLQRSMAVALDRRWIRPLHSRIPRQAPNYCLHAGLQETQSHRQLPRIR